MEENTETIVMLSLKNATSPMLWITQRTTLCGKSWISMTALKNDSENSDPYCDQVYIYMCVHIYTHIYITHRHTHTSDT